MSGEPVNPESVQTLVKKVEDSIPALVDAANALSGNPSARGEVKIELDKTLASIQQALNLVKRLKGDSENPGGTGGKKRRTRKTRRRRL